MSGEARNEPLSQQVNTDAQPSVTPAILNPAEAMPTATDGPNSTSTRPRYWRATLYLHVASLLASVVYVILAIVVSQPKYGITAVAFFAWIGLSVPGLSLLVVSGPELLTRFFRRSHRGWMPAVHIGLNLLVWLLAAGMGSFTAYTLSYMSDRDFGDWETGCPDPDAYLFMCWGVPLFPYMVAMIVFLYILMAVHFVIFILAIQQHKERQRLKRDVV